MAGVFKGKGAFRGVGAFSGSGAFLGRLGNGQVPVYASGGNISGGTGLTDTLTASPPSWTNSPTGTALEWYKNGVTTGVTTLSRMSFRLAERSLLDGPVQSTPPEMLMWL